MSWMSFLDPGGIGRSVLNPGGAMDWAMPYLGPIGGAVGSVIGGYYGGPAGAAAGGAIGGSGGVQLGSYLSKDPKTEADPFSTPVLKKAATTGAISGAAGYAGASLGGVQGVGFAPEATVGSGGGYELAGIPVESSYWGTSGGSAYGVTPKTGTSSIISDGTTPYQHNPNLVYGGPQDATLESSYSYPDAWQVNKGGLTGDATRPSLLYGKDALIEGALNEPGAGQVTRGDTLYSGSGTGAGNVSNQPSGNNQNQPVNKTGPLGNLDYKTLGGTMLLGSALDYAGNKMNQNAALQGQQQYRDATTWTPDRTATYMGGLNNLVQGVYADEEAKKRKSVAEMLAGAGRGGGAYGGAADKIGRERRETASRLLAQGLMTTSQPPNLPLGAFNYTSPEGTALSNTGGMVGKYGNTAQQLAMLQMLYGNQARA